VIVYKCISFAVAALYGRKNWFRYDEFFAALVPVVTDRRFNAFHVACAFRSRYPATKQLRFNAIVD